VVVHPGRRGAARGAAGLSGDRKPRAAGGPP